MKNGLTYLFKRKKIYNSLRIFDFVFDLFDYIIRNCESYKHIKTICKQNCGHRKFDKQQY